ncbi:sensor histidine kinase [Phaeocystidibacter luteus]|uniref:histidine kinase n=1 Tax=Phaeocystidibacter luteus TaxID=911197 RepID=A0A6N6RKK6_9FLAO|nr:HAMP domain-containing sensor histidine kinase [Phaeocystidibacter luteus]KAB2807644.1 HAMP domain-containing histidine kinase [Phaeocystidibacter luteus]
MNYSFSLRVKGVSVLFSALTLQSLFGTLPQMPNRKVNQWSSSSTMRSKPFNTRATDQADGYLTYVEGYDTLMFSFILGCAILGLLICILIYCVWRIKYKLKQKEVQIQSNFAKLEEIERQRVELLQILGHDMRGPIWGLRNYVETLQRQNLDVAEQENLRVHAVSSLKQVQNLLEELIEWGEAKSDFFKGAERVELKPLVESLVEIYRLNAFAKNIEIYQRIEDDLFVKSNRKSLSTILRNLLDNAIKHTSTGRVAIFCAVQGQILSISIADTGAGMSQETIRSLRNNTHQCSNAGTHGETCSGKGLQTAFKLCDELGMKLMIESDVGVGTTVTLKYLVISNSD